VDADQKRDSRTGEVRTRGTPLILVTALVRAHSLSVQVARGGRAGKRNPKRESIVLHRRHRCHPKDCSVPLAPRPLPSPLRCSSLCSAAYSPARLPPAPRPLCRPTARKDVRRHQKRAERWKKGRGLSHSSASAAVTARKQIWQVGGKRRAGQVARSSRGWHDASTGGEYPSDASSVSLSSR